MIFIYDVIDILVTKTKGNKRYPPFYSYEIIKLIKYKKKVDRRYKTYKNLSDQLEFKALRYSWKRLYKGDFVKYKQSIEGVMASNPKKFTNCSMTCRR